MERSLLTDIEKNWRNFLFWLSEKLSYPFIEPDMLQLCFTFRCNLRCKMCNMYDKVQEFKKIGKPYELSVQLMKDLISQAHSMKIGSVYFVGGEPFVEENIFDIISYTAQLGMASVINTNGVLLNETRIEKVLASGLSNLNFSIDGPDKETYEIIRGVDIFEKVAHNLELLLLKKRRSNLSRPSVTILCVVMNQNIHKLPEMVSFAKRLGISVQFQPVVPDNTDQSQDGDSETWIKPEAHKVLDDVVDHLIALKNDSKFSDFILNSYQELKLMKFYFRKELKHHRKCYIGFNRLIVTQDGKLYFCVRDPVTGDMTFGDTSQAPLRRLWRSKEARQFRKYIKTCKRPCLLCCSYREDFNKVRDAMMKILQSVRMRNRHQ